MNYELEYYEGELRDLRKFKEIVDKMPVADVWHEGSGKFYKAHLMYDLNEEDIMGNPYG